MEQQLIKPGKVDQHSDVQSRETKRETQDVAGLTRTDGSARTLKKNYARRVVINRDAKSSAVRAKSLRRKIVAKNRRNDAKR